MLREAQFPYFCPWWAVIPFPRSDVVNIGYARHLGKRTYPNAVAYLGELPLAVGRGGSVLPLRWIQCAWHESHEGGLRTRERVLHSVFRKLSMAFSSDGDAGGAGSEGCLKVNIYAPVVAKYGSNLPVYNHGGIMAPAAPSHTLRLPPVAA
ncbi:unnamed protein product [Cyclocybe aegerita]|uniref:Uncharacterized protein n=1 Tax=Cyclocybe aegerita TaxID=1973307 RepID=A0A8S0X582_CYCAE|nr:unnamed protein product [Cyclocybe aegerita]